MLLELAVENYAVIERVRVRFHRGLNLLTGETGSGKSIVVDALGLLFGGRASQESVRTGASRARISGIFEVPREAAFARLLDSAGIQVEDGELLLEREISSEGKSRAFAGSRPITVGLLKDMAPFLGDIHGQHEHQSLMQSPQQRKLLDRYAGAEALCAGTADLYRAWRALTAQKESAQVSEQERARLVDFALNKKGLQVTVS